MQKKNWLSLHFTQPVKPLKIIWASHCSWRQAGCAVWGDVAILKILGAFGQSVGAREQWSKHSAYLLHKGNPLCEQNFSLLLTAAWLLADLFVPLKIKMTITTYGFHCILNDISRVWFLLQSMLAKMSIGALELNDSFNTRFQTSEVWDKINLLVAAAICRDSLSADVCIHYDYLLAGVSAALECGTTHLAIDIRVQAYGRQKLHSKELADHLWICGPDPGLGSCELYLRLFCSSCLENWAGGFACHSLLAACLLLLATKLRRKNLHCALWHGSN